jgi:hypothetical protein
MAINQGGINVTLRTSDKVLNVVQPRSALSNNQPVTLKSTARTINVLKDIADVVEVSPQDGHTLVYNAATDKYEVKQLTISNIGVDEIDGGTF